MQFGVKIERTARSDGMNIVGSVTPGATLPLQVELSPFLNLSNAMVLNLCQHSQCPFPNWSQKPIVLRLKPDCWLVGHVQIDTFVLADS